MDIPMPKNRPRRRASNPLNSRWMLLNPFCRLDKGQGFIPMGLKQDKWWQKHLKHAFLSQTQIKPRSYTKNQ